MSTSHQQRSTSRHSSRSDLSYGSISADGSSFGSRGAGSNPSLGGGDVGVDGDSIRSYSSRGRRSRGGGRDQQSYQSRNSSRHQRSYADGTGGGGTKKTSAFISLKNVRKSFGVAASFGGYCGGKNSSSSQKMKFSKLNTPELEALTFPTSNSSLHDLDSSSSGAGGRRNNNSRHNNKKSLNEYSARSTGTKGTGKTTTQQQQQPPEQEDDENLPPAIRHPIPMHTCALIAGLASFFIMRLPSLESLDEVANIDTFTNKVLNDKIPLAMIILCRLGFAAIMLGNALSVFLYGDWYADTDYFPGSKLRVAKRIPFKGAFVDGGSLFGGIKCISTFTLWCWIIEGSAFFMAGMIPLFHYLPDTHDLISPWMFRTAIILWEIGAPVSILVSAVVKYALWPMAMEQGENVKLLKAPGALLQHNLNSIAALLEVGLLGGLPVRLCDYSIPPLYGICYLLYSYLMMYKWTDNPEKNGPQFFYPFFDQTLGLTSSLCLVALLAILSMSFAIFVAAEHVLLEAEKYIAIVPIAAIILLSMMVCRVQD